MFFLPLYLLTQDKNTPQETSRSDHFSDNHSQNDCIENDIKERKAFEVKYSAHAYSEKRYAYFREQYSDIPLQLIHADNVLKIKLA